MPLLQLEKKFSGDQKIWIVSFLACLGSADKAPQSCHQDFPKEYLSILLQHWSFDSFVRRPFLQFEKKFS